MGILNVTPDSFSDGDAHPGADAAIAAGLAMRAAGADVIDVGGESTRPGAAPVPVGTEIDRIRPVIRALAQAGVLVSADTRRAEAMAAALESGARIINDVSGLTHDPAAPAQLAGRNCAVILMHMRGTPATMTQLAHYADVVGDVATELSARVAMAEQAGIERARIAVDPGFGFAKKPVHSVALLQGLRRIAALGLPVVAGVSRKGFIGRLADVPEPRARDPGSLAAGLFALSNGAAMLRVHDVAATCQAVRVWHALVRP